MSEALTYLLENEDQFRRARLPALYSDFRPLQTTNPDGYNANVDAWRNGLARAAVAGVLPSKDQLTLTADADLLRALDTKEWGRPMALPLVVNEALRRGDAMTLSQYMAAKESILPTAGTWSSVPWKVMGWGLRQLGIGGAVSDKLPAEKLVLLGNVEQAAGAVSKKAAERLTRTERIYSKERFSRDFAHVMGNKAALSNLDTDVLLRYLSRDKKLIAYDGETVKLNAPGELDESSLEITQADTSIASLTGLLEDMTIQIDSLEVRIDTLTTTAKEAVAKKNRIAATAALRSKKVASATLEKRLATRAQLEDVHASIEQAQDQLELVRVLDASATALRGLNAQIGGAERVDGVVDALRAQMDQVTETGDVVFEPGGDAAAAPVDDEELDEELASLEEAAAERERAAQAAGQMQALEEAERAAKLLAEKKAAEQKEDEALQGLQRMSIDERPREAEHA